MKIFDDGRVELDKRSGAEPSLEELQKFVGGYVEYIALRNDILSDGRRLVMVVNEEGKRKSHIRNRVATDILNTMSHLTGDYITGPAMILTADEESMYVPTIEEEKELYDKTVGAIKC